MLRGTGYLPGLRTTHQVFEHLSEPGGHEVVEDGVDGRAEVETDSGDNVDVFKYFQMVHRPGVDVAPHQAVRVEGSPAEAEYDHQHTCQTGRQTGR